MDSLKDINELPIVQSRLEFMLKKLYTNISSGTYKTQEDLNRGIYNIVKTMSRGVEKPIYDLPRITPGSFPNRAEINTILIKIYNELNSLSDVLFKTGSSVETNFNFAVSKLRKLGAGIKHCNQQLAVYSLYLTDDANSQHFGETFSSDENIDRGSKFLSEEECFINLEEGTVSLPLEGDKQIWPVEKITLGERSNCVIGNNVQANTPVHGKINTIHDGNLDTWVEFERIVSQEDKDGITAELKITLEDKRVVNGIRIVPVLLGARTTPRIKSIQVSENGRTWRFLDEEISVADYLLETNEDRFHLSPHSGKFSGEFNITFPPRFVRFLRITLHQSSAFTIKDTDGVDFLRFALAIKELEIYGVKYKDAGEFISNQITFPGSIKAVALRSTFDPVELPPEAGNLEYSVSFDDGVSWARISRQKDSLLNIPEVVFPPEGQTTLRYKVKLLKNEEAFAAYRKEETQDTITQTFGWGEVAPLTINLLQKPSPGTLTICDPEVATVGNRYPKISLGRGTSSTDDRTNSVRTGAAVLKRRIPLPSNIDTRDINIQVDGTSWTKVGSFASSSWHSPHYTIEKAEDGTLEVVFGNDDPSAPKGRIPTTDQEISLYLDDEQVTFDNIKAPYVATLDYPTNGEKADTVIFFDGETDVRSKKETIPNGIKKYQLPSYPINTTKTGYNVISLSRYTGDTVVEITEVSFATDPPTVTSVYDGPYEIDDFKEFVDGYAELEGAGDWTLDNTNGVLYFKQQLNSSDRFVFDYITKNIIYLKEKDWDFVDGSLNKIQIYERGYYNIERSVDGSQDDISVTLPALNSYDKECYGVIPKSVRIKGTNVFGTGYNPFEIPFINGATEFLKTGVVDGESIPYEGSALVGTGATRTFTLKKAANYSSGSSPTFSNTTVFANEKNLVSNVTSTGDWYIDQSTGQVTVYLGVGTSTSGITVSYFYDDEDATKRLRGSYSVDLKKGIVHFSHKAVNSFTVEFKQAPYKIRYTMSHQLQEGKDKDYTIDLEKKQVTIKRLSGSGAGKKLSLRYKYVPEEEDLFNLADHFSPLLRGIAIKAALV